MIETPTKPQLQAAFDAKDVELFTVLIKQCGEEELAFIQEFTQQAADKAYDAQRELFSLSGKLEDMMLAGLRRLVDLSTVQTGLRSGKLDLRKCRDVIRMFRLDSNIEEILMYQNPEGYSFIYLLGEEVFQMFLLSGEIQKVFADVSRKFHAQIDVNSSREVLDRYAKSRVANFFQAYQHLLDVFPKHPEVAEAVFRDIPCNYFLENRKLVDLSPPLFKFWVNREKPNISEAHFYHIFWGVIMNTLDAYKDRIEKMKCLLETFSNGVLDCVALFRHQDPLHSSWRFEGATTVGFLRDINLLDYAGLVKLSEAELENSSWGRSLREYCLHEVEQVNRRTAVTLAGIYNRRLNPQFGLRLLPVDIQRRILSHVSDPRVGFEHLQRKMGSAIVSGNTQEMARLIRDRKMDINQPYEGVAPSFLTFALRSYCDVSTIMFLVEQCGARFTVGDLYFCGPDSANGRYLREKQKKEAITLLGIFKFRRQHPSITHPGMDAVRVVSQKVVGQHRTALDLKPVELDGPRATP